VSGLPPAEPRSAILVSTVRVLAEARPTAPQSLAAVMAEFMLVVPAAVIAVLRMTISAVLVPIRSRATPVVISSKIAVGAMPFVLSV